MNKLITLLLLTLTPTLSLADKKGYFYGVKFDHKDSKTDSNTLGVEYGKHIHDCLDIKVSTNHTDKKDTSRFEIGPKFKHKFNKDWSSSLYVAIGQKFTTYDNNSYWVMTPGIKKKINEDWSLGTSIRFRDSVDTSLEQSDRTYGIKLVKHWQDFTVSTRYRMKRGDSNYNAIGVGLKYEF